LPKSAPSGPVCSSCGSAVKPNAKFCSKCGNKI
jgi:predicted amidophosphoribosyltransferase